MAAMRHGPSLRPSPSRRGRVHLRALELRREGHSKQAAALAAEQEIEAREEAQRGAEGGAEVYSYASWHPLAERKTTFAEARRMVLSRDRPVVMAEKGRVMRHLAALAADPGTILDGALKAGRGKAARASTTVPSGTGRGPSHRAAVRGRVPLRRRQQEEATRQGVRAAMQRAEAADTASRESGRGARVAGGVGVDAAQRAVEAEAVLREPTARAIASLSEFQLPNPSLPERRAKMEELRAAYDAGYVDRDAFEAHKARCLFERADVEEARRRWQEQVRREREEGVEEEEEEEEAGPGSGDDGSGGGGASDDASEVQSVAVEEDVAEARQAVREKREARQRARERMQRAAEAARRAAREEAEEKRQQQMRQSQALLRRMRILHRVLHSLGADPAQAAAAAEQAGPADGDDASPAPPAGEGGGDVQ